MNPKEKQNLFRVKFPESVADDVYVAADERHEVVQTIGERYDSDRFNVDWSDFEIVTQVERVPESTLKRKNLPNLILWHTGDGVRGLEARSNIMGGFKGLYWIK